MLTTVKGPKHACNELVDSITLMYKRNQRRDAAFVIADIAKVRKDELLELLNLVLQYHEIVDGLVPFVGVIDGLETNIFFVLERSVEFGMCLMERQLGKKEVDVFANERAIATDALAGHAAVKAIDPAAVGHGLYECTGVALLHYLVDGDEGFKGLDLVGHDGLPVIQLIVSAAHPGAVAVVQTYTFIPDQKASDDLWSHV